MRVRSQLKTKGKTLEIRGPILTVTTLTNISGYVRTHDPGLYL